MTGLRDFWEHGVGYLHRHIGNDVEKRERHGKRFQKLFLDHLPKLQAGEDRVLDWGCGGGWIALRLAELFPKIVLYDLSWDSITSALRYLSRHGCGDSVEAVARAGPDGKPLASLSALGPFALINCVQVVHHFPSLDYFRQVASCWVSLEPQLITFDCRYQKVGVSEMAPDKYESKYTEGLSMDINSAIKPFLPKYRVHHSRVEHTCSSWLAVTLEKI